MTTTTPESIDEKADKYPVVVSDFYARKNSILPVFRLPPETLADIFVHAAHDYYEDNDHPDFCVPHWVNVSYVCRDWCDIALNCPILWSYHFTVSLRWTEEILARSKQAPLKIRIYFDSLRTRMWWSRLVKQVLNHAERIQELHLNVPEMVLPQELSLHAPRLQILEIRSWNSPSAIKHGDILPLHTLKITCCPLLWYSIFNLRGLTTLSLCYIPSPCQQNIGEFLTTLSCMQALTNLHLDHALPSARGFPGETFPVFLEVGLPCLVHFFVAAPLSTVIALLGNINIPLKAHLRLDIDSEADSSIDDYGRISSVLAQRLTQYEDPSSSGLALSSLAINLSEYTSGFTISSSEHSGYDPDLSMLYPPRNYRAPLTIHVAIERLTTFSNVDRIASDICCSIPLSHVHTLNVINPPSSLEFWRKILGHLKGLRRMKLNDGYMPNLIPLFTLPADGPVGTPSGDGSRDHDPIRCRTFVPVLEELDLERIIFVSEESLSGKAISREALLDALSGRQAFRLSMAECYVEDQDNKNIYRHWYYI